MIPPEDEMALWLSRELSVAAGNATQELLLDDVAERMAEGADLDAALRAVTKHEARAGDFGVEVAGSLLAIAVVEGLKVFWSAYFKELEEKAGKWMAGKTVEYLKSKFKSDAAGPEGTELGARIKKSIEDSATRLNVAPAELAPTLTAITPALERDTSKPA